MTLRRREIYKIRITFRFINQCNELSFYDIRYQTDAEENLHKVELEKARLEAALEQQVQRVEMLQKELADSHQVKSY